MIRYYEKNLSFRLLLTFSSLLFISGCDEEETTAILVEDVQAIAPAKEFSYVESLSEEKIKSYNTFLENGSLTNFTAFTPTEMVLVHMDLVMRKDYQKLYLVTYNDSHYTDVAEFVDAYTNTVATKFEKDYLMYRHFDSIHIIEDVSTEDLKIVKLEISMQSSTYAKIFALLKENGIWKMDYYHLLKPEI